MTKTHQKMVHLELRPTWTVSRTEDMADEPQVLSMSVPAAAWRHLLALAELHGFRAPRGDFFAGQTAGLVAALKDALAALPNTQPPRRAGHVTPAWTLACFFREKANAKGLQRFIDFADQGGALTIRDN